MILCQANLIYSISLHHKADKRTSCRNVIEDDEVSDSCHLPQILDTPISGSSHGHKVTFRSPVTRNGLVLTTPHLVTQPVSFNVLEIPSTETSDKDTAIPAKGITNMATRCGLTRITFKGPH